MKKLLKKIKVIVRKLLWRLCAILPTDKNKIVVSSYYGRGYGDNPKYIVEELRKQKENIKVVWLLKNKSEAASLPEGVDFCIYGSIKSIYHLSTAKVWIDNCRKGYHLKRKNQKYLQTWHGFALKRIESDVENSLSKTYVANAKKDSKSIDLIVSDSSFMTSIYKNSFWYSGEIVEWGSPRNDILMNADGLASLNVKKHFGIEENAKIILYAPTFRKDLSLDAYSINAEQLITSCEEKFASPFVLLVRLHPNVAGRSSELNFNGSKIYDASQYHDMQELLSAADVLISDYSSLMFDFALTGKPCFQFATDIDDYKSDRNFYFALDSLPFLLATNNEELKCNIESFDHISYKDKINSFFTDVGMIFEGKSSAKCVNWILNQLG